MSNPHQTIRIFISSPGDVAEEREGAKRVIAGLQRLYPNADLQAVLWEELTLPATASFQETIDYLLQREPIDIAVFILWSRLGSPLGPAITRPDGGAYRSGTEREFDLMLTAFELSGRKRPVILAYVRDDDTSFREMLTQCPAAELEQIIQQRKLAESFVREQFQDAEGHNLRAYRTYSEPPGFCDQLKGQLRRTLDELLEVDKTITWTDEPYRGLQAFDVEHAPIFFGRHEETCELLQLLRDQRRAGCAFVVIVGASGSGKSSLARAGVAANLDQPTGEGDGLKWKISSFIPALTQQGLCHGLVRALAEALPDLCDSDAGLDRIAKGIAENASLTVELTIAPAFERARPPVGLLLILDQMEELWTDRHITEDNRESFLAACAALAESGHVSVLGTLRSDFYHHAQASPTFRKLKGKQSQFDLGPPDATAIHRLITEPARLAGLQFERSEQTERSLDEKIWEDASQHADALPLLEYTLSELYRQRDENRGLMTYAAYVELGGVEGAIGKRADETFTSLPTEVQAAFDEILPLLVSVDVGGEQSAVRRRASLAELTSTPARQTLTERLIADRFLTTDRQDEQPIASLAHEALLRSWNRIVGWIGDNREQLRLRARVEQLQQRWEQQERDDSLLLAEGLPLDEGRQLLRDAPYLLTESTKSYIDASIAHHDRKAKQSRRIRTAVLSTIAALLAVMIVGGTYLRRSTNASRLVKGLLQANTAEVPNILSELASYPTLAHDELAKAFTESPQDSDAKLHAALAFLGHDDGAMPYLGERLLDVSANQFSVVRDLLDGQKGEVVEDYWRIATDTSENDKRRFQAACALASYDPENEQWNDQAFAAWLAGRLVGVLPSELLPWRNALRGVRAHLAEPLSTIYRNNDHDPVERRAATDTLADYQSEEADRLFDLLAESNEKQFGAMFDKLLSHRERAVELGRGEVAKTLPENASEDAKESLAMRQANSAVMLLRMDAPDQVWPLLKHSPDPRVRSYIIHWLSPRGGDAKTIHTRYEQETDVTIKRALLLCLGEFELADSDRQPLIETLLAVYRSDPDAGLHAAAEWLLRQWDASLPDLPVGEPPLSNEQKSQLATLTSAVNDLKQQIAKLEQESLDRQRMWEEQLTKQSELPGSLSEGLIAHYGLDESEGQQTESSVEGQPIGSYRGPGVVGQAVLLDGKGGQFDCGDGFQLQTTDAFSYGCWFYSTQGNPTAALFSKLDITTNTGFDCWLEGGRVGLTLIRDSNAGGDQALKVLSDELVSSGDWHHVMVVYEGSGVASGVSVYVDGRLVPSSVSGNWQRISESIETNVPLVIGGYSGETSEGYGGVIDDIRIYNRQLKESEALALYREGLRSLASLAPAERLAPQQRLLTTAYQAESAANAQDGQDLPMLELNSQLELAQSSLREFSLDGMRRWYVNGQGQTFVILDAGEFQMGSPDTEDGRAPDEGLHRRNIGRRIAVATKEVTHEQWRMFSQANPNLGWKSDQEQLRAYIRSDDSPMNGMTWYEAAWYCNWLSEQEGIPEEQWCYEKKAEDEYGPGMTAKENFLELTGYRLPTEAEWEYACRAGGSSSRYYGVTDALLPRYAWYQVNGDNHTHPVASLKPNDFGLFDMQGNVYEWCYDVYDSYPTPKEEEAVKDAPPVASVEDAVRRVLRGGAFNYLASAVRSANRLNSQPVYRISLNGFRPARTYHLSP